MPGSFPEEDRAAAACVINSFELDSLREGKRCMRGATRANQIPFFNPHSLKHFLVALPSKDMRLCIPLPFPKYSFLKKKSFFKGQGRRGGVESKFERQSNQSCVRLRVICLSVVASAADEDEDAATEAQKHIHNGLKYSYAASPSPSGRSQEPDVTQQEAGPTTLVISTL